MDRLSRLAPHPGPVGQSPVRFPGGGRGGGLQRAHRTGPPGRGRARPAGDHVGRGGLRHLLLRNLLERILRRSGSGTAPGSVGEAISTLRDDVESVDGVVDWPFDVTAALAYASGAIAVLLTVDARITVAVFLPLAAVIATAQLLRTRLQHYRAASRQATARVTGVIGEIFTARQAIQVAGAEAAVVARLRRLGEERKRAVLRERLQDLSLDAVFTGTVNLGTGLTLLAAASAMRAGTFTIGDFALFATYLSQVAEFTSFVGYLVAMYQKTRIAFRRLVDLLQGAPPAALVAHHPVPLAGPLPDLPAPARSAGDRLRHFAVRGITVRHPRGGGIEDASLEIEPGTLTVITGRVGSGKSTLLRAMLGLVETQSGERFWNGRAVARPGEFLVPPRVAYVPQVPVLLSGTVRENICLGLPCADEALRRAVRDSALERDLLAFPQGLDTVIGTRGVRLSGGQIQRTAVARAPVREPELFVFDDISSALDVETEQQLWRRVLARGVACVAVSHRPAVLRQAHRIIVLDGGRIVGCGRLEELLETCPAMRDLWSASAEGAP
nr:ABC transporter ATP-binding protein [Symbiobacterium terraclitae]